MGYIEAFAGRVNPATGWQANPGGERWALVRPDELHQGPGTQWWPIALEQGAIGLDVCW
jgi:hypothetical protein